MKLIAVTIIILLIVVFAAWVFNKSPKEFSMTEKKKYDLPDNLVEMGREMFGLEKLRNKYIKQKNGYANAKKAAEDYGKAHYAFWGEVRDLYPELNGKSLGFDANQKFVTEAE